MYRTQCLHFWGWLAQHHPLTLCEVSCSPALIIFLLCPALSKLASCPSPCPRLSEAQTRHSQTMAEEQLSPSSFSWDMALTQHTGLNANKLSGSTIWHASLLPSGIWEGFPPDMTQCCVCALRGCSWTVRSISTFACHVSTYMPYVWQEQI